MKKLTLIIFLLSNWLVLMAQSDEESPIDVNLKICLEPEENQTTAGMVRCALNAAELWDKELNLYYQKLMKVLTAEEKIKLKNAQRKWLEYKTEELSFSGDLYFNMEGTMWYIIAASRVMEFTKQRTLELKEYYENKTGK